ncbi:MAG: rRNA pseudouridine synthase [Spirochaetes bacterium]|nr:rRNA pseudouridine synthase [Spirochaetota bacterium]
MNNKIRINKFLSLCGSGSRRKVEAFIQNKQVKINGKVIHSFSEFVDIDNDIVELNNKVLRTIDDKHYILLNKPRGYITTVNDERGRPTVMDLIPEIYKKVRVNPVGRLDLDSEGLLLLTNDGDLAYKLTHPKFEITKEYIVKLNLPLAKDDRIKIENGIILYGVKANPSRIVFLDKEKKTIKITLTEGKKRHIRVTFSKFSYKVKNLKRVSYGPLRLSNLKTGFFRKLTKTEIEKLQNLFK